MNTKSDLPRIGLYEIERKLGSGGMGTVYLGTHVETRKEVAVKVLSASFAQEEGVVERFRREIDAMRQISGPNVVQLFESGSDDDTGQLYFAMEYVEGETLGDRLKRMKRLSWDQAVDIALQICTALKVAHNAGIIHRDLKPSNLLLGKDGVVKLTDFGVAQLFATQRLTVTGGVIGTAEYMSPEQTEGKRATKTSDLYSLGAVLYVMLTGLHPFTGNTALDILRKHQIARFDRPSLYNPDMPRILEDVVTKLLEKKPEDRYADAHIVSLRLKEVVKRVELAHRDNEDGAFDLESPTALPSGSNQLSETAETRVASQGSIGANSAEASPATLMRDMFKADLERESQQSPLAAFFDQTWVLLLCFVLLILGGIWWFSDPPQRTGTSNVVIAADNEIDRILDLAKGYQNTGNDLREERILNDLLTLIDDESNKNSKAIKRINARLKILRVARKKQRNGYALAKAVLKRAQTFESDGRTSQARQLANSIISIYQDDVGAKAVVEAARNILKATIEEPDDDSSD